MRNAIVIIALSLAVPAALAGADCRNKLSATAPRRVAMVLLAGIVTPCANHSGTARHCAGGRARLGLSLRQAGNGDNRP